MRARARKRGDMGKLWYVSGALASTVDAIRRMNHRRTFGRTTRRMTVIRLGISPGRCSSAESRSPAPRLQAAPDRGRQQGLVRSQRRRPRSQRPAPATPTSPARAVGGPSAPCTCRNRAGRSGGDVAARRGAQALRDPPRRRRRRRDASIHRRWAHLAAGADETCFYIDVLPGTTSDVVFTAREIAPRGGLSPMLDIAEYGPKGPVVVRRPASSALRLGRQNCNRDAADAWSTEPEDAQARAHRPLRLGGDHAPGVGHLGRHRRARARAVSRLHRHVHDGGEEVPHPVPPRSTECVPK